LGQVQEEKKVGPVLVTVFDKGRLADYLRMVSALRAASIPAELYLGDSGMKAQLKYADRRGSPCVVLQGSQEKERGEVQIKDLVAGVEAMKTIRSTEEKRQLRPAQFAVPESELVEAVKTVLANQQNNGE
jgi:histidyl-tRNA synthetase